MINKSKNNVVMLFRRHIPFLNLEAFFHPSVKNVSLSLFVSSDIIVKDNLVPWDALQISNCYIES